MTQEDKQLLLKDLCGRLPYGVKVSITAHNLDYEKDFGKIIIAELIGIHTAKDDDGTTHTCFITCYDEFKTQGNDIDTIKPYLRPVSSMTEKEMDKLFDILQVNKDGEGEDWIKINDVMGIKFFLPAGRWVEEVDEALVYLRSIHIDIYNFIEEKVALEAPEGMYEN